MLVWLCLRVWLSLLRASRFQGYTELGFTRGPNSAVRVDAVDASPSTQSGTGQLGPYCYVRVLTRNN